MKGKWQTYNTYLTQHEDAADVTLLWYSAFLRLMTPGRTRSRLGHLIPVFRPRMYEGGYIHIIYIYMRQKLIRIGEAFSFLMYM